MSTAHEVESPVAAVLQPLGIDQKRGTQGFAWFIASEAVLFTILFFSYFFLSFGDWRWLDEPAPKLTKALIMLGVLIFSSVLLRWGERRIEKRQFAAARAALVGTIGLGIVFLILSYFDYSEHLKTVTPWQNAYGSLFYTITSFHLAHLILGLLMLAYVVALPEFGPTARPPHKAYTGTAMYWHFVDIVWIFIVLLLYVLPNLR
jgi:heme/copper-type cytochrome/quinol oxidase subunit 3